MKLQKIAGKSHLDSGWPWVAESPAAEFRQQPPACASGGGGS